jgi:2-polyprenyl-3-methyl-5-hydroxy-6-metoxy-1,4-benzoquinol methylase
MLGLREGSALSVFNLEALIDSREQQILLAWQQNAQPWIRAIEDGEIESRLAVTNQAIIDAVLAEPTQTAVDIGCGEGWLVRSLTAHGLDVLGVDGVPQLIEKAQASDLGRYRLLTYDAISSGQLSGSFDAVICNFSLLGDQSTLGLFAVFSTLLNANGRLIIQTLHPLVACGTASYEDGWRPGSWIGFKGDFAEPAPWYFRTLATWVALFRLHGFQLTHLHEPIHPRLGRPASVILVGQLAQ